MSAPRADPGSDENFAKIEPDSWCFVVDGAVNEIGEEFF